ncbi:MAG: ABC transporter permease, partial [Thermoanaerobaculia bacterium]
MGLVWDQVLLVFRKEVKDNLRDRRTLMAALLYPLLGPVLVVGILVVMGSSLRKDAEKTLEVPVVGAENAPSLIQFISQQDVEVLEPPEDPVEAVRSGELDVVLVIPEDYGEKFNTGRPAKVELIVDDSRDSSRLEVRRLEGLLNSYSRQIGSLRLMARGVNPTIARALAVQHRDLATDQSQGARILGMAPYFIVLSIFMGGLYLAIDTTAGERERGSLEPLLITPVSRGGLVSGKALATLLFTLAALVETLIAFAVILNYVPIERYLGIRIGMSGKALWLIFLISFPMALPATALQMLIASLTRSFKEAQNYLAVLPLVPAIPGMLLAFLPVKPKLWMMLVPTYGQQILISRALRDEPISGLHLATSIGASLAVGLLVLIVVGK